MPEGKEIEKFAATETIVYCGAESESVLTAGDVPAPPVEPTLPRPGAAGAGDAGVDGVVVDEAVVDCSPWHATNAMVAIVVRLKQMLSFASLNHWLSWMAFTAFSSIIDPGIDPGIDS